MARHCTQHMLDKGTIGFWELWQGVGLNTLVEGAIGLWQDIGGSLPDHQPYTSSKLNIAHTMPSSEYRESKASEFFHA